MTPDQQQTVNEYERRIRRIKQNPRCIHEADLVSRACCVGIVAVCRELDAENERLAKQCDMSAFDYQRLVEWFRDPQRKDPSLAFTAGAARTAAMAFVDSGVAVEIQRAIAQARAMPQYSPASIARMSESKTRDDILYAFSIEPTHDRETLERYLNKYPELTDDLIDLSHELRISVVLGGVDATPQPDRKVDEAWQAFVKCGSAVVSESERLRAALAELSAEFRLGGDEHAAVRLETVLEET
jgi:hypothetical protein